MQTSILFCNSCQFEIHSVEIRKEHYRSNWHRYNVKRRCAGIDGPITEKVFKENLDTLRSAKEEKNKVKCKICNKTFHSNGAYQQHLLSKTHKKRNAKVSRSRSESQVSHVPSEVSLLATATAITTTTTTTTTTSSTITTTTTTPLTSTLTATATAAAISQNTLLINDNPSEIDNSDPVSDAKKNHEHKAIPLATCLFCSLAFPNLEESLKHMGKRHGFWIPYMENVVDLEEFMRYLGEKIGLGRICLHCNGRKKAVWPNLHAVQQHMDAKSHCKLRFDEWDLEEYDDFYKFPSEDEDIDGEEGTSRPKKGVVDVTVGGELVLHDGTIIGHRDLLTAYNKTYQSVDSREEVVMGRIEAECRKITLRKTFGQAYGAKNERTWIVRKKEAKWWMKIGIRANKLQGRYFREQNPK